MKTKTLALLIGLFITTGCPLAVAQDQVAEEPPASPGQDQPGNPSTELEAELDEDRVSDEESEEEADEGPGRFIPTEEISQDLGVSFPADI